MFNSKCGAYQSTEKHCMLIERARSTATAFQKRKVTRV